ncbi:MAG: hypothetical protein JXA96_06440 [Sedimentisphaerales bacterium]|nr:hypothetical protein [Sedimentisphaerales bacterium]
MKKKDSKIHIVLYMAKIIILFALISETLALGPEDAEQWAPGNEIEVDIHNSSGSYLAINDTLAVSASAEDCDLYRVGENWYDYWDDVDSGGTEEYYHIWWTTTLGSFIDMYGAYGIYQAPDCGRGFAIVQNITITAHADDCDEGDEYPTDAGYQESVDGTDSISVYVWQMFVGAHMAEGPLPNNNAPAMLASLGGTALGWVIPGTPTGTTGYYGNTELYGMIPNEITITNGYNWYQYKKGIYRYKTTSSNPNWVISENSPSYTLDFGPDYLYIDDDPRSPNETGSNTHMIFALDTPGFNAGASNNNYIPPDIYEDYDFDLKCWIEYNGVRASNENIWQVDFELERVSGYWSEVFHILLTSS